MQTFLAYASFVIIIGVTIPYMIDIVKGKARPARAARVMFFILLILTLLQQHSLGSGYAMAVTIGELVSSTMLLILAIPFGVGGLTRANKICYLLLGIDVLVWLLTKNALLAIHLSILADMISFWPTIEKTWRLPRSETPLFFWGGAVAPIFSILAQADWSYAVIIFPLYLTVANLLEVFLIYTRRYELENPTLKH